MAFSLGGFHPTSGPCGCCDPPCDYSLCVAPSVPCLASSGTTTLSIRYQGPGGIDTTRTAPHLGFGVFWDCYASPAEGEWTVTVSHPCLAPVVTTVTVVQCRSQTIAPALVLPFSALELSDDYGSVTLNLIGSCRFTGSYSYTSLHTADTINCGYFTRLVKDQTGPVLVVYDINVRVSDAGLRFEMVRAVPAILAYASCSSFDQMLTKAGANTYCAALYATGDATAACEGEPVNLLVPLTAAADLTNLPEPGATACNVCYSPWVDGSCLPLYPLDTTELGVTVTLTVPAP